MKISVVIPVFEDWNRLAYCLEALQQQSLDSTEFEVIVVDNSENPTHYNNTELSSNTIIVHEPLPGSYAARNKGAELASGTLLAFTDSDCIPHKDWLTNAIKRYKVGDCDLIGGKISIFRPPKGSNHIYIYENHSAFSQKKNLAEGKCVTANLIVKQSGFHELGGFDSTLKSGGDWEFSKRLQRKHYKMVYDDSVIVSHPARKNLGEVLKKQFRIVSWGGIIAKRKYGYSNFRILLSEINHSLRNNWVEQHRIVSLKERWIFFYINAIKKIFRILVRIAITVKLIDPKSVRK